MQFSSVMIFVAGLASLSEALVIEAQATKSSGAPVIVKSLGKVLKTLNLESDASFKLLSASRSTCRNTIGKLTLEVKKSERAVAMSSADYEKASGALNLLNAKKTQLDEKLAATSKGIDSDQAALKKLRAEGKKLAASKKSSLQQLDQVIEKTSQDDIEKKEHPLALNTKASKLERLSESLSFLQSHSEAVDGSVDDGSDSDMAAGQAAAPTQSVQESKPLMILRADRATIEKASISTERGFNLKEKNLMKLIEDGRKIVATIGDNSAEVQASIANKLTTISEINGTSIASVNGLATAKSILENEAAKCKVIDAGHTKIKPARMAVIHDIAMAQGLIDKMTVFVQLSDVSAHLSEDLTGLEQSPMSFLQVGEDGSPQTPQEPQAEGGSAVFTGIQNDEVSDSADSSAGGPFDAVNSMISGLIRNLKGKLADGASEQQACQEEAGNQRRKRISTKADIDKHTSDIQTGKFALTAIENNIVFQKQEQVRLKAMKAEELKELAVEQKRLAAVNVTHFHTGSVIKSTLSALSQMCKPAAVGALDQCGEAKKLLGSANTQLLKLDAIIAVYKTDYEAISKLASDGAQSGDEAAATELIALMGQKADRNEKLSGSQKALASAKLMLKNVDKAKVLHDQKCNNIETREQKMAKRKDEIANLKDALEVLNGESIPV